MIRSKQSAERLEAEAEDVLDLLDDSDCQAFLGNLDNPRTAKELSRRCNVPHSTTYRKLAQLREAGLVETTTEIRKQGNHQARYYRDINSLTFTFEDGGLSVDAETDS